MYEKYYEKSVPQWKLRSLQKIWNSQRPSIKGCIWKHIMFEQQIGTLDFTPEQYHALKVVSSGRNLFLTGNNTDIAYLKALREQEKVLLFQKFERSLNVVAKWSSQPQLE
jgi:hypothetical protein